MAQETMMSVRNEQYRTIHINEVSEAKTISDINPGYPASWINDYISVEVVSTNQGETFSNVSKAPIFTSDQIEVLKKGELGTEIEIKVTYKPDHAINSSVKELEFAYTIVPDVEATYPGGIDGMEAFVKEHVFSKLENMESSKLEVASVRFIIDETGKVANAQISNSSKDDKADQLILEAFHSMPLWSPAKNITGETVSQQFVFAIGSNMGC